MKNIDYQQAYLYEGGVTCPAWLEADECVVLDRLRRDTSDEE
jgi:hypothetical protein